MLKRLCLLLLFFIVLLDNTRWINAANGNTKEPPGNGPGDGPFLINADDAIPSDDTGRHKRKAAATTTATIRPTGTHTTDADNNKSKAIIKINYLNDTHKQLMVHWVNQSQIIICLAKDPPKTLPETPSTVYISYDYGEIYVNKTDLFKLDNGEYSFVQKFFTHSKYKTHTIFNDIKNKVLFLTDDFGQTFMKRNLNFTPNDVSFHDLQPNVFLVYDKSEPKHVLWMTEDYGKTWRVIQEFVKSYFWIQDKNEQQQLVVERGLPSNLTTVFYTNKQHKLNIYAREVEKVDMKSDYIFTAMKSKRHSYDIYVSYKFGKKLKCVFDTNLDIAEYTIVDVTGNRALIAVSHSSTMSNLYVSENLAGRDDKVHFTLSLANVLAHFPNSTWRNTWLHYIADEAFADVYKVEGVAGIYIASQIIHQGAGNTLGPHNLSSRITFDHGGSWRPITPPSNDMHGQLISCLPKNNCSLHLSQRFNQLDPDTRARSILTTKSAPGYIIATGVIGTSMKGHYGVFVSTDAGITWRHSLHDSYLFSIADHGGLMTAVENLRMRGETRHLFYSKDEGENWIQIPFHEEEIRLYGLMTEPEEKTAVFSMFGSQKSEHRWMIVKIDLSNVFKGKCTDDDYKYWSPLQKDNNNKYVPCVLGQQNSFKRRIQHADCYNGVNFQPAVKIQQCECEQLDYECDFSFIRTGDAHWHCIKNSSIIEDPYVVPTTCRPGEKYSRTKGYRKITGDVCLDGYANQYQPDEIPCPTTHMMNMLLFTKREKIVQMDLLTLKQYTLEVPNLKNVIAIDFDLSNNCIYWADIVTDTIARFCDKSGTPIETLVSTELVSVEGMALDWVSKNLYFVDGLRAVIELVRTDIHHSGRMRRTILDSKVLIKPRGIVVHPKAGYMFWTDWASINPSVKRSNLDGSYIKTIADKKTVEWPNGITVDYIAERVYWVDARKDYIGSTDLDGNGFRKVTLDSKYVSHPFAVAVFKDDVYWDDWRMDSIFVSNKDFGGHVGTLIANVTGLMDIKVIAHGTQQGANGCAKVPSPCSSICVGAPNAPYYKCLCPDGMQMKDDKCLCPGGLTPFANFTCPQISGTCSSKHFTCKNGACIPLVWQCDNENDCGDNSDETKCGSQTCPPNYFVCSDGKCIPHYWKCDYENDCSDGGDEKDCPRHNCTADTQFTCANGRCISKRWECDGENDCRDNSDEKNCAIPVPTECKSDEFKCKSGNAICISALWRCDGEFDCNDRSDEEDCTNTTCRDFQFSCGGVDGECIYQSWVCDGDADCRNGADEKNCSSRDITNKPSYVNPFAPNTGSGCQDWMFTCANNKCIPIWWKCDHANDCEDGSDELGCNFSTTGSPIVTSKTDVHVCEKDQFQCESGECISQSWVCDDAIDCTNGEDEADCDGRIHCHRKDRFKCRIDGNCIPIFLVCNGRMDCPDGSDEEFCATNNLPGSATPSCSVGYFPCDLNRCFPLASMCDLKADCNDGFDEGDKCKNMTRVYQVLQMGVDGRSVNDSSFLLYWWIPLPDKVKLEYLPSICAVKDGNWKNATWTEEMEYRFDDLQPNTNYNMTVYVRVRGNEGSISPPAKYFLIVTGEGIPSSPYNLTVKQGNGTEVFLTWNAPLHANGVIVNYEVTWYPPNPPVSMRLSDNSTSLFLLAGFEAGQTYSFYVEAHNYAHKSEKSEVKSLQIQDMDVIQNLHVTTKTNNSIGLSWDYKNEADGFMILVGADVPYPKQANYIFKTRNVTISNLPPGNKFVMKVFAYKILHTSNGATVFATTLGDPLPKIPITELTLLKVGTSVKVSWERAKDSRSDKWVYGVYYGVTPEELLEGARVNSTDLSATIHNLDACESYTFSVGLVGPWGTGPIQTRSQAILTSFNEKAAPKKVSVQMYQKNPLQMLLQWAPSCHNQSKQVGYMIEIKDKIKNISNSVTLLNATGVELSKVFNVSLGAVYDIRIRTFVDGSIFSAPVTYEAPPIMPPHELKVFQEINGSYVVTWSERDIPEIGDYVYEVLVSEGTEINMTTASRFQVKSAPFIFNNHTAPMYTFTVRTKSLRGYSSVQSEVQSATNEAMGLISEDTSSNVWSIWLPVCLLVVCLCGAFGFLAIKYRRLQNSFTRFANSHYDTRSEAATFDDNILDEDDTPQIRGFSDDEPLVVA